MIKYILPAVLYALFVTASAYAADDYCYLGSYGRGVGTIPTSCKGGKINQAGLCYDACRATYSMVGPVCWQGCPSGYVDTGALCHINKALTASGSWGCAKRVWGVCVWPSHDCPSGYTNAGAFCALNTPPVPAGYHGLTGLDITKNSYPNGAGTIPTDCGANQYDAGLCYSQCKAGYSGIGPVCWNKCPSGYVACGAGCATSSTYCAKVTADQVTSTLMLAVNIATLGASGEAEAGAKSAEEAAQTASKVAEAKKAWAAVKASEKYKAIKSTAKGAAYAEKMDKLSQAQNNEEALRAMAGFDPTGVGSVINAFAQHVCNN